MKIRTLYFFGFILIAALLSTSLYLQFFDNFLPCPLCSLQRLAFCGLGIAFLFGLLVSGNRIGRFFSNSLLFLFSLAGIILAGRQVWLQIYPSSNAQECGASLQYMMKVLPMNEVIQKVFEGSAECTQRSWEFLSLTMAQWSLVWFIFFFIMTLYLIRKGKRA